MLKKSGKLITALITVSVFLALGPKAFAEAPYMKYDFYYSVSGKNMGKTMTDKTRLCNKGVFNDALPYGGSEFLYQMADESDLVDCGTFSEQQTPYRLLKYLVSENGFPVFAMKDCTSFGGDVYDIKPGDVVFLQNERKYPFACALATDCSDGDVVLNGVNGDGYCTYSLRDCDGYTSFLVVNVVYPSPEEVIFTYLKDSMAYSNEVCSGILANIFSESDFNSEAREATGKRGYGLCQWTGDREKEMIAWCEDEGINPSHIIPQLQFLKHELKDGDFIYVDNMLRSVSRNSDGAYDAAHAFCYFFEQPENYEDVAEERGEEAQNLFYPIVVGFPG